MSEKTLKFNNIRINKKEFHKSNQPIDLDTVKKVINTLLVIKKMISSNHYVLSYLK